MSYFVSATVCIPRGVGRSGNWGYYDGASLCTGTVWTRTVHSTSVCVWERFGHIHYVYSLALWALPNPIVCVPWRCWQWLIPLCVFLAALRIRVPHRALGIVHLCVCLGVLGMRVPFILLRAGSGAMCIVLLDVCLGAKGMMGSVYTVASGTRSVLDSVFMCTLGIWAFGLRVYCDACVLGRCG